MDDSADYLKLPFLPQIIKHTKRFSFRTKLPFRWILRVQVFVMASRPNIEAIDVFVLGAWGQDNHFRPVNLDAVALCANNE